jgi:hypothetical protein
VSAAFVTLETEGAENRSPPPTTQASRGSRSKQTHEAFHSTKDDAYPILLQAGLYSLVIPRFAEEPVDESAWFLARLRADGTWAALNWQSVRR